MGLVGERLGQAGLQVEVWLVGPGSGGEAGVPGENEGTLKE